MLGMPPRLMMVRALKRAEISKFKVPPGLHQSSLRGGAVALHSIPRLLFSDSANHGTSVSRRQSLAVLELLDSRLHRSKATFAKAIWPSANDSSRNLLIPAAVFATWFVQQ